MSPPRAGRRSSPIVKSSVQPKKGARKQTDVILGVGPSTSSQPAPKRKKSIAKPVKSASRSVPSTSRGSSRTRQSVGRWTGGVPRGRKSLQLANVGSDDDSADDIVVSGKKRQSRFHLDTSDSGN